MLWIISCMTKVFNTIIRTLVLGTVRTVTLELCSIENSSRISPRVEDSVLRRSRIELSWRAAILLSLNNNGNLSQRRASQFVYFLVLTYCE